MTLSRRDLFKKATAAAVVALAAPLLVPETGPVHLGTVMGLEPVTEYWDRGPMAVWPPRYLALDPGRDDDYALTVYRGMGWSSLPYRGDTYVTFPQRFSNG